MNRLSPEKRVGILHDMVESKSLRGISRTRNGNARRSSSDARNKPVALNTVYKLLADAGDAAIDFLDAKLCNLPCTRIEADEAYTWVKMHPVRVRKAGGTDEEKGVFWIWIALDPVSKLVAHYYIGGRGYADGQVFIEGLAERISGRFQLTTDSLASYRRPIENSFGANIDYATVKKQDAEEERLREELGDKQYRRQKKKSRAESAEYFGAEVVVGNPDLAFATTNHIESFFQKLRQNLRRMVRKTTGYSKNLTNLKRTIALYVFHYNFCRIHKTLGTTPAIAAGIDDTRWEWEHFLDLIDAYTAEKRIAAKLPTDEQSIEPTCTEAQTVIEPSYFVYLSRDGDYAKVHHSSCKNARHGSGSSKQSGQFWLCETVGDALALAEEKAPGMAEKCKVCFSDYNTLSYRDPARRSSRPQPQRRIR